MRSNKSKNQLPGGAPNSSPKNRNLYTTQNYWPYLKHDLKKANEVVVVSPYLTLKRMITYFDAFNTLRAKNGVIKVITLPSEAHDGFMIEQSKAVIEILRQWGIDVGLFPQIHQKIILIDDKISWDGSINWLSHTDATAEHIRRLADVDAVAEVRESLQLYLTKL